MPENNESGIDKAAYQANCRESDKGNQWWQGTLVSQPTNNSAQCSHESHIHHVAKRGGGGIKSETRIGIEAERYGDNKTGKVRQRLMRMHPIHTQSKYAPMNERVKNTNRCVFSE